MPKHKGCSLDTNCVIEVLNKIILILSLCVLLPPSLRRHDIDVAVQMSMMEEHISNVAQLWLNFFFLLIISIIYYNNLLSVLQFGVMLHAVYFVLVAHVLILAKSIHVLAVLQKLFNFAQIIQLCKNYSSLPKLFKFAKIIQFCKNYSTLLDPDGTPYLRNFCTELKCIISIPFCLNIKDVWFWGVARRQENFAFGKLNMSNFRPILSAFIAVLGTCKPGSAPLPSGEGYSTFILV